METDNEGILISGFLFWRRHKIPWNSIKAVYRYPRGYPVLSSAYFGREQYLLLEYIKDSKVKKVRIPVDRLPNREKFLNELYQHVRNMEDPDTIIAGIQKSFLQSWLIIILLFALAIILPALGFVIFEYIRYGRLLNH